MIAEILYIIFSLIFGYYIWDYFNSKNEPPGPIKIPLLGNLVQVSLADPVPYIAYDKLSKKYGDIMSIKLGMKDTVVLSSYETVKDIYNRDETLERPCYGAWWDRNLKKDAGLIFSTEELWRKMHGFTVRGLQDYGFGKRNSMEGLIHEELEEFTDYIRREIESREGILHFDIFFHLTFLNLVLSLFVGRRYEHDDPRLLHVMHNVKTFFKSGIVGAGIMTAYPFLRYVFPEQTGFNIQMEAIKAYHDYARDLLEEHRKRGDYKTDPQCFVDLFIQKMEETKNDPETIFTEDQFLVLAVDFIQAGSETTSNVLNFAILLLAVNEEKQDKLHQEVMRVIGHEKPSLKDRDKCTYVQAIMYEAHRYSRILPHLGLRNVTRDFVYKGYRLKKGTMIFPNMHSLLFDKEFWGDPQEFRPERFIDQNGKLIHTERVLNFGIGKRKCIGEALSKDSFFLYLTTLAQKFVFKIPEGRPTPNLEPQLGFSMSALPYDALVEIRQY